MQTNAAVTWSLGRLLKDWCDVQIIHSDIPISGLSLDSRSISKGDLFFALQGSQQHGVEYSQQAVANGAAALAWEASSQVNVNDLPSSIPCLEIENLQNKLGLICKRFYNNPSSQMNIIAVTGTDGKTSVSQFIAQALHQLDVSCGVIGTLGYGRFPNFDAASHTTPDAVRMHSILNDLYLSEVHHVVLEASSHGLNQGRLNGVEIDTAVFTNLGRDHMDYHQSLDDYFRAKRLLFQSPQLKNAVINIDDEAGVRLAEERSSQLNVITYSIDSKLMDKNSYVNATNIEYVAGETSFEIVSSFGRANIKTNLFGKFNISNLLAVMGSLITSGFEFEQAVKIISNLKTVPGRMEFVDYERNLNKQDLPAVVIDYAHTPQALINVLKVLKEHCAGKLWCVFGCGGNRDKGKRKLMAQAVEQHADIAVVTDDNPRFENPDEITDGIVKGFSSASSYTLIHDRQKAIEYAIQHASAPDIVLIAGKGHEAVQIINHDFLPFDDKKIAREILLQAL